MFIDKSVVLFGDSLKTLQLESLLILDLLPSLPQKCCLSHFHLHFRKFLHLQSLLRLLLVELGLFHNDTLTLSRALISYALFETQITHSEGQVMLSVRSQNQEDQTLCTDHIHAYQSSPPSCLDFR